MSLILIVFTVAISVMVFRNPGYFDKFQLNPYQVIHRKEYYRLLSHGFLHADWVHLLVNMIVLFSFGQEIERQFEMLSFAGMMSYPRLWFLFLYISGIVISSLLTVYKERNNFHYNAVGASGAVSAIVFAAIFFSPIQKIYFYAVIPMPGIAFGILYLLYSQYMSRTNKDNINHDAHFIGAVYGFIFPIIMEPGLIHHFINQIKLGLS
jgi:membrane associated rhomboid family serine protease